MRVIKLALISAIIFFLIATAFSLFIPSHVRISKAINIHADKQALIALISNQESWKTWHPAFMPNDSVKIPPIHVLETHLTDSSLVVDLRQGNKQPVTNGWNFYEHNNVDSVTVQWYMDFHLKWYPWKKFGSLFFENTYGTMMQQGLENIKGIAENR